MENSVTINKLLNDAPVWWAALKADKEIYIEIRKENDIDAYYNGGAVIKGLKWNAKNGYTAKIHAKYLSETDSAKYVDCPLESLPDRLPEIKRRIAGYYSANCEKGIQAALILNRNNMYVDSEYQDTHISKTGERKMIRFDLVRADLKAKKIIIQELKRIEDARLLKKGETKNSRELNEIREQLALYSEYISDNKERLLHYYQNLIVTKQKLGLFPTHFMYHRIDFENFTIAEKPQLIINDYQEPYAEESKKGNRVKAIVRNLELEGIDFKFTELNINGYSYKWHLLTIPREEWESIFAMIPWIEEIEKVDPTETLTDHLGKRTRPLKYVKYKSAAVQLNARMYDIFLPFNWTDWSEGLEMLRTQDFEELDLITTCKLLTIILYYKESVRGLSPLGIPCRAHDLEDGRVLKLLKQLKINVEKEWREEETAKLSR